MKRLNDYSERHCCTTQKQAIIQPVPQYTSVIHNCTQIVTYEKPTGTYSKRWCTALAAHSLVQSQTNIKTSSNKHTRLNVSCILLKSCFLFGFLLLFLKLKHYRDKNTNQYTNINIQKVSKLQITTSIIHNSYQRIRQALYCTYQYLPQQIRR